MKKFDPYELCPCGSDRKFKFCCYKKARKARESSSESQIIDYPDSRIQHMAYKIWEDADFKVCLGFDKEKCNTIIKNAHALQNNKILNRISEDGHLYIIAPNVSKQGVKTEFKKISRNKASTFFGFCDYHDNVLFKPIEQNEYVGEPIQKFLFAFRACCFEYHRKIRLLNSHKNIFKEKPAYMLNPSGVYTYRITEFDLNDFQEEYEIFRHDYYNKNFENIITFERILNCEVEFAVSSSFAVKDDLYGKEINDIYSIDPEIVPNIYLNIFPLENKTIILMSYNSNYEDVYGDYFNQIKELADEDLKDHLNFLIINYTENVFFSPRLIERLNAEQKESILRSFQSSVDVYERLELLKDDKFFKFNLF